MCHVFNTCTYVCTVLFSRATADSFHPFFTFKSVIILYIYTCIFTPPSFRVCDFIKSFSEICIVLCINYENIKLLLPLYLGENKVAKNENGGKATLKV